MESEMFSRSVHPGSIVRGIHIQWLRGGKIPITSDSGRIPGYNSFVLEGCALHQALADKLEKTQLRYQN